MEKEMSEVVAEKKKRAPRKDYGYAKDAVVTLTEKSAKYRGKRKSYFDIVAEGNGKTVAELEAGVEGLRGYLRFFVQDGTVALSKVA
jgi:hypothetical protein